MPGSIPRLAPRTVFGRPEADGIRDYLADHGGSRYAFYGYGKFATRDALDLFLAERPDASNVVLPAYLPPGIVEPFREAGLEPRYYPCDRRLRPEIDHIERLLDDRSLAVMVAQYFGHAQSRADVGAIRDLCGEYDVFLIDDNAHAPLSRTDGQLLGTFGDVGITSLRKLLPIPNGAVLFLNTDRLDEGDLTRAGVRDGYTAADYRYFARSLGRAVSDCPGLKQTLSTGRWLRAHGSGGSGGSSASSHKAASAEDDPRAIYEAAKEPMSRLSLRVIDRTDPIRVIALRRANYRVWDRAVRDLDGVRPVFPSLHDGVCPQYYPVIVDDPDDLGPLAGVGTSWPPLPREVDGNPDFGTENYLSTHLHTLPVHQGLDLRGLGRLQRNGR